MQKKGNTVICRRIILYLFALLIRMDLVVQFTEELEMAMKKAKQNREWRFEYLREQAVLDDQYNQGVEAGRSLERENTEREKAKVKQERKRAELEKKRADELEKENQKLREELAKRDKKGNQ